MNNDLISRKAAIDAIWDGINMDIYTREVKEILEELPSIAHIEKVGHWEFIPYDYNPQFGNWHCSECNAIVMKCTNKEESGGIPLYRYCPQCGAKM